MSASEISRWHRIWISSAGVTCFGLGGLLVGGCAPLGNDLSSKGAQPKAPQVAKATADSGSTKLARKPPAATKLTTGPKSVAKSTKKTRKSEDVAQVAGTTGHVRISDTEADPPATLRLSSTAPAPSAGPGRQREQPAVKLAANTAGAVPDRESAADWQETTVPAVTKSRTGTGSAQVRISSGAKRNSTRSAGNPRATISGVSSVAKTPATRGEHRPASGAIAAAGGSSTGSRGEVTPAAANREVTSAESAANVDASAPTAQSAHDRRRADVLMARAHTMYNSGFAEEALRLASVAAVIENARQAQYEPGEERPSDFVSWLQTSGNVRGAKPQVAGNRSRPGTPTARRANADQAIAPTSAAVPQPGSRTELAKSGQPRATRPVNSASPLSSATTGVELLGSTASHTLHESETSPDGETLAAAPPAASEPAADSAPLPPPVDETPASRRLATRETRHHGDSAAAAAGRTRAARDDAAQAADPFPAHDPNATSTQSASQLSLIGMIGLLTGIGGLVGLKWWQVQERKHFQRRQQTANPG